MKFGVSTPFAFALRDYYVQYPFFGYLIEGMKRHINKNLSGYIAINVRNGYVHLHTHPKIDDLPIEKIKAVVEHVCTHMLLQHLTIRQCLADPQINDMAEDLACNCIISKKDIVEKMGGLMPKYFGFKENLTKENYWDLLMDQKEKFLKQVEEFCKQLQQDSKDMVAPPGPSPTDGSDGEPEEESEEGEADGSEDPGESEKSEELQMPVECNWPPKTDKKLVQLDDHEMMRDGDSDPSSIGDTIRDLVQQAYSTCKGHGIGSFPGGMEQLIIDIIETKTMPWNIILRRAIRKSLMFGSVKTWTRENRIKPGLKQGKRVDYVCNLYVLMDTSGSIGDKYISVFSNEMRQMRRAGHQITVVPCDAAVVENHVEKFRDQLHVFPGRGGTDMGAGVEWILKNGRGIDVIIILTDGATGPFEKPPVPVIWAVTEDCSVPVDWGTHITLKE